MFSYTTNGNALAKQIDSKLRQAMYMGLKDTALEMKNEMHRSTSGPFSSIFLRQMGHPFGRSYNRGKFKNRIQIPLTPINLQTGALQNSYYDYFSSVGNMQFMWTFGFAVPYAGYVLAPGGTKRMIDRHYWDSLARVMKPKFIVNVRAALKQFF